MTLSLHAQKTQLPKGWLVEKDAPAPDMYRFCGKTLHIKTDPVINYGYQYSARCRIRRVNDSVFTFSIKKEYTKDNNTPGNRRKRGGNTTVFPIYRYTNWQIGETKSGEYHLFSSNNLIQPERKDTFEIVLIPMTR